MIAEGDEFRFHDARGLRGQYVVTKVYGTREAGLSPWACLWHVGTEGAAWASERWLREGIDTRGIGWEPAA